MSGVLPEYFSVLSGILHSFLRAVPVLQLYSLSANTSFSTHVSLFIPSFVSLSFCVAVEGGRLSPEQRRASLLQRRWRSRRVYVLKGLSCGSRAGRSHWHPAFDPLRVSQSVRQVCVCICVGIIELWLTIEKGQRGHGFVRFHFGIHSDINTQICNAHSALVGLIVSVKMLTCGSSLRRHLATFWNAATLAPSPFKLTLRYRCRRRVPSGPF